MRVVWSKSIHACNPWEPEFFGIFYKQESGVTLFFKERSSLCEMSETDTEARTIYTCGGKERLPLPRKWSLIESCNTQYLLFSPNAGIDLSNQTFLHSVPDQLQHAYARNIRPEKYYEEASYPLGAYTVSHKGYCGYTCTKLGEKLWDFAGKGYLYTDMLRWNNRLFFGTAGHGGYFYILDIDTGNPLSAIKTGGTASFAQKQDKCYVLHNTKDAQLLCIDLSSGQILSRCDLPGTATVHSRISLIDGFVHGITFEYTGKKITGALWNCVEI